jgi:hypothetical protein
MAALTENLNTLLDWKDFSPNLFEATAIFDGSDATPGYTSLSTNKQLRISGISFASGSLDMERHPLTRKFLVKNYVWENTVTITWREDEDLSVWKFHTNWLTEFYDKSKDTYKTGATNKKKKVDIQLQKPNVSGNLDNLSKLTFWGMVPSSAINLALGWDMSSEDGSKIEITYNFDGWDYS